MYQYLGFGLSVLLKPSHLEARQAASHQSYNVQPYLVHSTGPAISYHFRQKQIVYPTLIGPVDFLSFISYGIANGVACISTSGPASIVISGYSSRMLLR